MTGLYSINRTIAATTSVLIGSAKSTYSQAQILSKKVGQQIGSAYLVGKEVVHNQMVRRKQNDQIEERDNDNDNEEEEEEGNDENEDDDQIEDNIKEEETIFQPPFRALSPPNVDPFDVTHALTPPSQTFYSQTLPHKAYTSTHSVSPQLHINKDSFRSNIDQ
ncbi:MAG: hypothetical protein EZS28_034850, partial [Streblomastix strix]